MYSDLMDVVSHSYVLSFVVWVFAFGVTVVIAGIIYFLVAYLPDELIPERRRRKWIAEELKKDQEKRG